MIDRILLRQGDLTLAVVAPADDLRWLADFFGPSYAPPADAAPAITIRLSSESHAPATGERRGERLAFALDSGPIRLPSFDIAEGGQRLLEADAGIAYDVALDGSRVVVRYSGNRLTARVRLMRVVREHFHNASLRRGDLVLHAAAVVRDRRAIVLAGRKRAGKTTMLLRLLRGADTALLANDRVLVTGGPTPEAQSIPTVVSVRNATLGLLPDVAARLADAGDFHQHESERRAAGPSAPVRTDAGIRLDARQLCDAVGRSMVPAAPIGALIVIDEGLPAGALRLLEPREAAPLLADARLGSPSGIHASDVFSHATASTHTSRPSYPSHASHVSHLAHCVPCLVSGRLGDEPGAIDRLLSFCTHACA